MGVNVPSAKGVEFKARDMAEARRNFYDNYDRIFGGNGLENIDRVKQSLKERRGSK